MSNGVSSTEMAGWWAKTPCEMVGQSHLTNDFGGTNETIIKHNDDDSPGLRKKHVHFLKTFRSTLPKKTLGTQKCKKIFKQANWKALRNSCQKVYAQVCIWPDIRDPFW